MSFCIYYNITKAGNHFGCQFDNEKKYIREIEHGTTSDLIAYAEVILFDEIEINIENIHKVVDEGFLKISGIKRRKEYSEKCKVGTFKLLTDKQFLDTSVKVKEKFDAAIKQLNKKLKNL